jgi:uncharacterized protein YecE (DUF72 family)
MSEKVRVARCLSTVTSNVRRVVMGQPLHSEVFTTTQYNRRATQFAEVRITNNDSTRTIRIGTAGWTIPSAVATRFPSEGSALQRYASVFNAVEINSTFHRSHRVMTFERWRDSVPDNFLFAVKIPKSITHVAKLVDCSAALDTFLAEVSHLAPKLGPLLLQLPPKLAFDPDVAGPFCALLDADTRFTVACEPRHATWFTAEADAWLRERRIARVAADPARHEGAASPGGWRGLSYYRLHGSPRMYYSAYGAEVIESLRVQLQSDDAPQRWCMFDNTASGAAALNALELLAALE